MENIKIWVFKMGIKMMKMKVKNREEDDKKKEE